MNDKSIFDVFHKVSPKGEAQLGISIVSHNVFWFQGASFATDTPPAPRRDVLKRLCSVYHDICPDVICLQEVQSLAAAETVARQMDMKYIFCPGGSYPQYGGVVLSHWPIKEIAQPQDFVPDRILIHVRISPENAPPFQLVNIHLPSSRQRGLENAQKRRLQELSLVLTQADILLGDFNETPDGQCASLLKQEGFADAALSCSAETSSQNLYGFRGDQIWLSRDKADALQGYLVVPKERLTFCDGETTLLSDHLPVGCLLS